MEMKENSGKYSVLMSVYAKDKPAYLRQAIESMLHQTVPAEQFVVIVDGPISNELEAVILEYEKDEDLFTIIRLSKNSGLANALNIGLGYCRNELVARMDADDISLPQRCEKELLLFEQYANLAVCGCNIGEFYDNEHNIKTYRNVPSKYEDIIEFSRRRQPFNHPTVIYKKNIILKCGGYTNLRRKEDFDLFSRILSDGYYVRNVNYTLYLYRANENNYKRRKSIENIKSAFYVYKLHLKRKGCTVFDFLIMCGGEIIFFILPNNLMKLLSDKTLRNKQGQTISGDL